MNIITKIQTVLVIIQFLCLMAFLIIEDSLWLIGTIGIIFPVTFLNFIQNKKII